MNNITIARTLNHMTAVQLAEAAGSTKQYISALENGIRNLGPNNVKIFTDILGVDKAWLLGCPGILPVYDPLTKIIISTEIIRTEEIPDYGVLYLVHAQTGDNFAVILASGVQFTAADWQDPNQPMIAAEIADYKWMDVNGNDAVMIDGLPRSIA